MIVKSSTKFKVGIGIIVFTAIGTMSLFFYGYVKALYIEEAFKKTDIVLGHIDATIGYVQNELRPKMLGVLPKSEFLDEAMSTSFMNKGIMSRFSARFPGYVYRRVAIDPVNPVNKADGFETKFIREFAANPTGKIEWQGLVSKDGKRYLIHVKGIVMQKECLACHGSPAATPRSIIRQYGATHGHNWKLGDVIGLESIAIPVDATFSRIQQVALSVFCGSLTGMILLSFILNYLYYIVSQRPLEEAGAFFRSIVSGERGLDAVFKVKGQDEISELAESFNHLLAHLRQSQQDLRASALKYRGIFEGSKDAIAVTDFDGLVVDVNRSGMDLLGLNHEDGEIGSLRIGDFFATGKLHEEFVDILEEKGFVKEYETRFKRKDGGDIDVLITATRREAKDGTEGGYDCIIRNITQRKKMELQLQQADRLASIGQLAAGVAHEINNPLSVVLGYAKLLKEDTTDSSVQEDLGIIYNNAAVCKKIVEDLLNFSRQTKLCREKTDIREIMESAVQSVENSFPEGRFSILRSFDPMLPPAAIDTGKIRQVCMNLLMNACQAMDTGGTLTISTESDAEHGGFFIVCSDTGTGIPSDIQGRIFDPFFTTKEPGQGTGLGLTVSYGIIKEHKGSITFETKNGCGTTFRVWLPLGVDENETIGAHCR
jgi:two-component system NtrC family sensor kinase